MNKQNIILDFEDFLDSYQNKRYIVGNTFIKRLFPITNDNPLLEEYSYLIGKVMGDGNLDSVFTLRFIGNEDCLKILKNMLVKKFQISSKKLTIRRKVAKGVSYMLQVNCAYFGRILYCLGAPRGNKTKISFSVPGWIQSDRKYTKRFLQALLEDELTTIKIKKCNYSVTPRLKLAKKPFLIENHKKFMYQIKSILHSFGIRSSDLSDPVKGDKTDEIYFFIRGNKKNILRFKEKIGFRYNLQKVRSLETCCQILENTL